MATNTTSGKEGDESTDERRARWEGANYGMTVCENGYVNVENQNYNESGHIYSVRVESGEATDCSCPHATHRGAHCKHQVAVESNPLVLSSASAASQTSVVADGGLPRITHHVEAPKYGGERYARCTACDSESIFGDDQILHDPSVPALLEKGECSKLLVGRDATNDDISVCTDS